MYNMATAQSIVDGQETTILFNSMIFDSGNDYNGSTNPITANSGKFTAPADGLYHFDTAIDWDESFQATSVYLQIRHDNIGGTMKTMATQTGYFDNANTVELIHLQNGKVMVSPRTLLYHIQQSLNDSFIRIHRAFCVNTQYIKGVVNDDANYVLLEGNVKLAISRRRGKVFRDYLLVA